MAEEFEDTFCFKVTNEELLVSNEECQEEACVIESIARATSPPSSTAKIHKVPAMVKDTNDYDKYYVPKVVSIGPYHFGNPKLEFVQNLKPFFANRLLSNSKETLTGLYKKLGEPKMVQELRDFYEEKSIDTMCNKVFTTMMLLDGCFILYYANSIFMGKEEDCLGLKSHQIVFVHQDLFLLENQIPFRVLNEVMNVVNVDWKLKIKRLTDENILSSVRSKRRWFDVRGLWSPFHKTSPTHNAQNSMIEVEQDFGEDHLLQLLQHKLTHQRDLDPRSGKYTFRNVNELSDAGIHFRPSEAKSLAHIRFYKGYIELPPITVDDSTKTMLLNLVAYEMCSDVANDSWVTSYICLLDSLIDHANDVKALRKAEVLDNRLGSDKEVAKLFNEIGTDLVPNSFAYSQARKDIQRHYDSKRNTLLCELKHEYVKSPWSFIALLGGVVALLLSGVQAYFSVWSLAGPCDDLCTSLKMNHHL